MKLLSALLCIALSAHALSEDINYDTLSDRFVTSVKEAQIDAHFNDLPQVQECVTRFPITDTSTQAAIRTAQENTAQCMRDLFKSVPEGDLTALSNKLQLDAYGVVKGKSNAELVNYLASRMEKALYGKDPSTGQVKKLKDQNLVDQKVFVDIYETQIGKNILLEISNYCYSRLNVDGSTTGRDRISKIAGLTSQNIISEITGGKLDDTKDILRDSLATATSGTNVSAYDAVKDDLSLITAGGQSPRELKKFFTACAAVIPKMCEYYENCLCKFKSPNSTTCKASPTCASVPAPGSPEPANGRYSCHVAARLKGYRTNLFAIATTKDKFKDMADNTGKILVTNEQPNRLYDKDRATEGESFDDLTSFTSSEVESATKSQEMATAAGEINAEECAGKPENAECAKFYYNGSEVQRFAQSTAGYTAATIVETERLNKLKSDKTKLLEYLNSRAYFDIAKKLEQSNINEEVAVAEAKARFETEREATFKEMTAAFERKQFSTEINGEKASQKEQRARDVKKEYENKGKEFQQLILFNNVVSSYLDLQRLNAEGSLENAGLNLRALTRETEKAATVAGAENSIQYFQGLSSGEKSDLTAADTPVVNIDFLDAILGKDVPAPGSATGSR